jgi:threonylcarbamoyladenosine tRNA methylthiotransferase MtaB
MSEVDHVIGNAEKVARNAFAALTVEGGERVRVGDIMSVRETAPHMLDGFGARARAWVQVQNGCDHRCTFCIIPFARGPSRSVPAGEVVAQIRRLVESGMREVVLTGVDITSYGADLPGTMSLGRLVRQILRHVPELERLRLSSIDHVETDPDLLDAIAEEPRLMPHLHLSLQAGDDLILKRMKRRHSRADSVSFCDAVRRLRPEVALGADLIAGFPTESEAHFANTLSLVDACGLVMLHVFPYSARAGTPAARMPQVDRRVAKERAARLRQKGEAALGQWLQQQIGTVTDVLVERSDGCSNVGRTPQFAEVVLTTTGLPAATGATVSARVSGHNGRQLQAEALA